MTTFKQNVEKFFVENKMLCCMKSVYISNKHIAVSSVMFWNPIIDCNSI